MNGKHKVELTTKIDKKRGRLRSIDEMIQDLHTRASLNERENEKVERVEAVQATAREVVKLDPSFAKYRLSDV
jgi:hypothetical protein